ncbi:MAG: SUMF1/EgtB/PvdO family nonheme iron enzyme [Candidatus Brocadiae bacterium]|nr:SUMF1/EgtB/PvdO family nonheme iron enzyme [Candidatus Brocadiia bacterium]
MASGPGTTRLMAPEGMVYIPPGSFLTGTSREQVKLLTRAFRDWEDEWFDAEVESARGEHLSGFWMDRYPVTNADYREFCRVTGHAVPAHWIGEGDQEGKLIFPRDLAGHPVVHVSWTDADAFARWKGKRLPAAIEWEKAARGPGGNVWPWGSVWDPEKCNHSESGYGGTTPVEQYRMGKSYYGVFDMTGNIWQWCSDKVASTEPSHPEPLRILKGGSWRSPAFHVRCAVTKALAPDRASDNIGFRCTRDV